MFMRFRSNRFAGEIRFHFSRSAVGLANERVRLVGGTVAWCDNETVKDLLRNAVSMVMAQVALPRRRVNTEATILAIVEVLNRATDVQDVAAHAWQCCNTYRVTRRRVRRVRVRAGRGYGDTTPRRHPIHDYSYKPTARFRQGANEGDATAYFGVELEIDQRDSDGLNPAAVPDIAHPLFYCKHDGSLNNGVELVSHPATRLWWDEQRETLKAMFARLTSMGWRSHSIRTCGMHVHVSRTAFDGSMHIYRFLHLIYRYPSLALLVSQRTQHQLNQWATLSYKKRPSLKHKAALPLKRNEYRDAVNGGHYDGVNQTSHTFELRIFNGTLNLSRFYKNLQFAWAALAFTAETTNLRHVTAQRFVEWVKAHSEQYPDLVAYFAANVGDAALTLKRVA